jgi:signal transduction histidine kinase
MVTANPDSRTFRAPASAARPIAVLNVNGSTATRALLTGMMRAAQLDVAEATTGESTLRMLQEPPDAVVLDVDLPDVDGYEICRRLKADPVTASVLVLLTSGKHVGSEHRVRGLEAGADAYLVQPFDARELMATLRALLRLRTAERNAKELAKELGEAVRIRDEFLSIAAHELKTPLTSLQLQLDSLAHRLSTGPARDDGKLLSKVDTTIRQTTRLAVFVDDLLDVSRITQGRFAVRREEMDLEKLVQDVVARFANEAARVGCRLQLTTAGSVAAFLDRVRFDQVLANLISNAIKYGTGRPIEVKLESTESVARIVVRDEGIGIAASDCERIFGRFERAVSPRHYGGLGLGLFISRRIVEAHRGTIWAESQIGKGSTFVVEVPRESVKELPTEDLAS